MASRPERADKPCRAGRIQESKGRPGPTVGTQAGPGARAQGPPPSTAAGGQEGCRAPATLPVIPGQSLCRLPAGPREAEIEGPSKGHRALGPGVGSWTHLVAWGPGTQHGFGTTALPEPQKPLGTRALQALCDHGSCKTQGAGEAVRHQAPRMEGPARGAPPRHPAGAGGQDLGLKETGAPPEQRAPCSVDAPLGFPHWWQEMGPQG